MATGEKSLKLASKLEIPNPRRLLQGYVRRRYALYDGVAVREDSSLDPLEIALANMINSRTSGNTAEEIWEIREEVNAGLLDIPNRNLIDLPLGKPLPGAEGISRAVTAMCKVPRVKLATTTKILHKKRPSMVPIFDRVVEGHYWLKRVPNVPDQSWGDYAVTMIAAFHRDLLSVKGRLRDLTNELDAAGTPLTECRILELLMWATLADYTEHFLFAS
jgi:hypothetical protein